MPQTTFDTKTLANILRKANDLWLASLGPQSLPSDSFMDSYEFTAEYINLRIRAQS